MSINVNVSRELKKNLNATHKELHKRLAGVVVRTAMSKIETPAKRRARVDTGRLRASINTKYKNTNATYNYKDDSGESFDGSLKKEPANTKTKFECIVGTNVVYAGKIERKYAFLEPAYLNALPILKRRLERVIERYNP